MARRASDSPSVSAVISPDDRLECDARRRGARIVAGVDEAGRGPLAGPVVVAAVAFDGPIPDGLNDSKRLTAAERERLCDIVLQTAAVSVVVASRARVDRMNILRASLWGMTRAVCGLPIRPDYVLVDGNALPPALPCAAAAVIGGDGLSVSIAAASIVAKVTRDTLMGAVGRAYPDYGFEHHMGYATAAHRAALMRFGPCAQHRRSFARVREQQLDLDLIPGE